jgi:hypothetical protein
MASYRKKAENSNEKRIEESSNRKRNEKRNIVSEMKMSKASILKSENDEIILKVMKA